MEQNTKKILYFITVFCKPDDLVETTSGMVTYREWLELRELPRFLRRKWPVGIETNPKTGEIALAHYHVKLSDLAR